MKRAFLGWVSQFGQGLSPVDPLPITRGKLHPESRLQFDFAEESGDQGLEIHQEPLALEK